MRINLELPEETRSIVLEPNQHGGRLTDILRRANLPLNTRCGERMLCKSCVLDVFRGGEWRKENACRIEVNEEITVRIPAHALLTYRPQVLSNYRINVPFAYDPAFGHSGLAAAVDIGTTTVALSLIELSSGRTIGTTTAFNKQMNWGDDVLTRINLCLTDPSSIAQLQKAVLEETLNPLLDEALVANHRYISEVKGWMIAGNTTMLHLAAGVDPSSMGFSPFTPTFLELQSLESHGLGLHPPHVPVQLLPGAAAYIGADITCGVLASGLAYDDGPCLLVDVGTNGEIVLKANGKLIGCATAAGPAFEGSGLRCGIRAGDGAIAHLKICRDPLHVECEMIGGDRLKAIGICGSAYIDFLAQGFRSGLLNASGRIQKASLPDGDPRLTQGDYGWEFELTKGLGKRPIVISDPDIARLLQAKAAIAAGIQTLLRRSGIQAKDLKTVYLAGGFGMHLNIQNALDCGLLPDVRFDQIQLVGNTSLAGATLATVDRSTINEISRIGAEIEIVELNLDPDFEDTYIDNLTLDLE